MKNWLYSLRNWLMYKQHRQISNQFDWKLKCFFIGPDQNQNTRDYVTEVLLATVGLSCVRGDAVTDAVYLTPLQKSIIATVKEKGYNVYLSGNWDTD